MDLWQEEESFEPIVEPHASQTVSESNKQRLKMQSQVRQTIALYNAWAPVGISSMQKSCDSVRSVQQFNKFGEHCITRWVGAGKLEEGGRWSGYLKIMCSWGPAGIAVEERMRNQTLLSS